MAQLRTIVMKDYRAAKQTTLNSEYNTSHY